MRNWILIAALPLVAVGVMSIRSVAQPGGPGGHGGPDGPGGSQQQPDGPDDDRRGPPMDGRGPFGPGGPRFDPRRAPSMDTQRGYMELVRGYSDLSRDPSAAGVAAVITANDLLKPRGADAAIEYFDKLLPTVKDPAITRAIRLQLVDLYRSSNRADEALKQLESLITAEPAAK